MATETEALSKMVPPGQVRPNKPRGGVIQILVTSSCNLSCFGCTQASNLSRKPWYMTPDQFETACKSLAGYWGIIGTFGGSPCLSPHFNDYCEILRSHFPKDQCGLWANALFGKGAEARKTYNPSVSNLNVHLDQKAYDEFKRDWPESRPFGLHQDSRHSPPFVAMRDVLKKPCPDCNGTGRHDPDVPVSYDPEFQRCECCNGGKVYDESLAWELISKCPINQHWSALVGVFRGELRAWFCEIAGAQSILHQDDPDYPDTGIRPSIEPTGRDTDNWQPWWTLPMQSFISQVRKHCHDCGVPMQGYGQLAQGSEDQPEQVSKTHADLYNPKRKGRTVELVVFREQLGKTLALATDYLGNAKR